MSVDPIRLKDVFTDALARTDPADRAACLEAACGGDAELRLRVEALLRASEEPDSLLDDPAPPGPPNANGASGGTAAFGSDRVTGTFGNTPSSRSPSIAVELGTVIAGRYTLAEVIGEGGMGSVYLASQTEPVKRQVALKLIKTGMDSKAVLARFDAERQALALMDHPNIARIYDGGVTPAGQPFFVMELVKGVPLTDYCDAHRLSVDARLQLFVSVCQAVQHAHQKGIIHRDLKPGNVLVTEVDGRPTPKVIDFGVAKATELKLTDMSFADMGAIVGTPAYMSPEQADPSSMDIDTRTDVYALGVMLYELLTGSPPIDSNQFKRGAILEILRMVREVEPPRPSTKLSTADALPSIASNRSIEPQKLSALVRGDLDWIVMKALDKDRTRRYETVTAFAMDVRRFLAEEPVEARPSSAWYRFCKLARRNKVGLTTAILVTVALVLGTFVSTWQAVRATRAESAARAAEDDAKSGRDLAQDAEQRAKEAAEKARTAEGEAKGERDQARAAYLAMFKLGKSFQTGGKWDQALAVYLKALELSRGAGRWAQHDVASVMIVGVFEFERQERYSEAERLLEQLVALKEEWHEPAQAFAYRQKLEAVRKLMPADKAGVGDFPKATFSAKVGKDDWMIRFDANEKFTISWNSKKIIEGTYKVVKDEIELTDESEKGKRTTGTYKWKLAERKLTFAMMRDEADSRSATLTSGPWEMKE